MFGIEGAAFSAGDALTAAVAAVVEPLAAELLEEADARARADGTSSPRSSGSVGRSARAPITRIDVRLALSHFTPDHFREHFVDASFGTLAEGAAVHRADARRARAPRDGVALESVEVEA